MSPSDEGLPPSQKVVVDGVTHVYYGPAQIQEGTAKFASDAEHNLEELHPPRSHVAVLHAGLKANEWQMGQSYAGLNAGIDLLKNGAASQKNKGNVAIVTLQAPILFAVDRGEPVVQEKSADHAVIARGTLLRSADAQAREIVILLESSGLSGSLTRACALKTGGDFVIRVGSTLRDLIAIEIDVRVLGAAPRLLLPPSQPPLTDSCCTVSLPWPRSTRAQEAGRCRLSHLPRIRRRGDARHPLVRLPLQDQRPPDPLLHGQHGRDPLAVQRPQAG